MLKISNSSSSVLKQGFSSLKTYTKIGALNTSSSAINGDYNLYTTFLAVFPAGHGLNTGDLNVGSIAITVKNETQGYKERVSVPLQVFVVSGNNVFFRTASSATNITYESLGLTNPSSGDTLKIKLVPNLFGYRSRESFTQTSTLS